MGKDRLADIKAIPMSGRNLRNKWMRLEGGM